jgi:hypothetical protein
MWRMVRPGTAAACLPAHSATLNIFGIVGTDGMNGVSAPDTDGGPGGAATATTAPNRDGSHLRNIV